MNDVVEIVRLRLANGRHIADSDIHDLVQEIDRLRQDCAEFYQVIGVLASNAIGVHYRQVVKALDNALAAADGKPKPHDDLLPFTAEAKP